MGLERGDDAPHRGKRHGQQSPVVRLGADTRLEGLQDLLLTLRAHPREIAEPAFLRGHLQPVERRDPELRPDPCGRLRPYAGKT
jgi:hypothetical protein